MRVLLGVLALLGASSGLKLNAPLSRRAAMSALVIAPQLAIAADNSGTYGGGGGYEAMPPPPLPAKASATAAAAAGPAGTAITDPLTPMQLQRFMQSKEQYESIGMKMTPSELASLETKIRKAYPDAGRR